MVDRRRFVAAGAASLTSLIAGCSDILGQGSEETDIQDSDGDGVIDSEDYAPRDPDVQERSDVVRATTTEQEGSATAEFRSFSRDPMDGHQCSISVTVGSADRVEVIFESPGRSSNAEAIPGETLATIDSGKDRYITYAPNEELGNGPLYFGDEVIAVAVSGSDRTQIASTIIV